MNPDRLAALEEERRFLLRSLADLEREFEAGDVDEIDYRELRDGYTVRAAATLRAIDEGRAALPPRPPVNWPRRIGAGAFVVLLIGVVWWALSATSAQRLPGQEITGDPADRRQLVLAQARSVQVEQPAAAAALYEQVLVDEPDNVEALTYRGWTLTLSVLGSTDSDEITETLRESVDLLAAAIEIDPTYPDPHCFLGIVQGRFLGQPDAALPFLDECLELGPPADIRGLVEAFRESMSDAATADE
jgi:tetratricopeptide (TPR) repeat protein